MNALTKQELVTKLSNHTKGTLKEAHDAVQFVLEEIKLALAQNRKVELRDFGVFRPTWRAERKGRNPANPESGTLTIPAKWVVKFKPSAEMTAALNKPADTPPAQAPAA